jgi:hypothetical protein
MGSGLSGGAISEDKACVSLNAARQCVHGGTVQSGISFFSSNRQRAALRVLALRVLALRVSWHSWRCANLAMRRPGVGIRWATSLRTGRSPDEAVAEARYEDPLTLTPLPVGRGQRAVGGAEPNARVSYLSPRPRARRHRPQAECGGGQPVMNAPAAPAHRRSQHCASSPSRVGDLRTSPPGERSAAGRVRGSARP